MDKKIVTLLELDDVFDPNFWASILGGTGEEKQTKSEFTRTRDLQHSSEMLRLQLPKLIKLLDR